MYESPKSTVSVDPQLDDEVIKAYLENRVEYYLPRYREWKHGSGKHGFNWAAMFFTPVMLVYRKLYTAAVVYFVLSIIVNVASISLPFLLGVELATSLIKEEK